MDVFIEFFWILTDGLSYMIAVHGWICVRL